MKVMQLNPYIISRPIRPNEPQCFFGREELFAFIRDNLLQGKGGPKGKAILLLGQRRIGKTSLLLQIPNAVDLKRFVFVQFDLQGQANQTLDNILLALAQEICWCCEVEGKVKPPSLESLKENPEVFATHFLPKVYGAIDRKNLVLLLDEFDVLDDDRREAAANQFFPYLASLIQQQEKLFIIPVVGRRLDDMPRLLRVFKDAPYQEIGLLDPESATKLITKPAEEILEYKPEAIEAILELSSGHPYCTNLLCNAIFSRARETGFPPVMREDVEAVVDKALESGAGGLAWFWDGLPPVERLVFSAIAEAQEKGQPGESWSQLKEYGIIQSDPLLTEVEKKLLTGGLLQLDEKNLGFYKVAVELVRRWLVKEHPLRQELSIYFKLEEPTLQALVKRAKALSEQEQQKTFLPLFGGKRFEILQILLKPLRELVSSKEKDQLTFTARKILELYAENIHQEHRLKKCVACVSQMAYLESLEDILSLLDIEEQKTWLNWIGPICVYELLAQQIEYLKVNKWKLLGNELETIFLSFHQSNLAEILKSALLDQLRPDNLSESEADEAETLTERVTRGTHQYIIQVLAQEENLAQQWAKACGDQMWKTLPINEYLDKEKDKYQSINEYIEQIAKQSGESVFHEKFTFKDIYIPLKAEALNGGQIEDLQHWADKALQDLAKRDQVLFIEGEPGQGKSTFCRMFANWIRQHRHPLWTPIWISLRDIKVLEANFERILHKALSNWYFATKEHNWLNDPNTCFVFLLDGLDDLITKTSTDYGLEAFLQQVVNFQWNYGLNRKIPKHRVLITSSPLTLKSLKSPIIEQQILPHLERVRIKPMDKNLQDEWIKQQWEKLKGVGANKAQEFSDFLLKNPKIRKFAQDPLLLYLLAAMHRDDELEGFEPESSDEETKLKIYEKSLDWVITKQLSDWLPQKLEEGRNEQKTNDFKRILAEAGLCAIQSGGIRTTMTMLEERLKNKDNQLANRLFQRSQTKRVYNTAISSFSNEPASKGWGWVKFNHKSFSEFLYAKRLLENLKDWTRRWADRKEFVISTERLNWEIYDLLGFGGLTQEIVGYLRPLLKEISKDDLRQLFERLRNFHIDWFKGEFMNNELAGTLAQKKMLQLQKPLEAQNLFLGRRQIDICTGLNVLILLLELQRYAQIPFYPCGKLPSHYSGQQQYSLEPYSNSLEAEESEEFDPSRILRLISYSRWLGAEIFVKTVGSFLEQINLRSADLRGAQLYGVKLNRAYLSGANLIGINLNGAELNQAFLGNAKLRGADLSNASLSNAFLGYADLSRAFLGNAHLEHAVLSGANLHTALLGNAKLKGAYFGDADLRGANLRNADLTGADLSCANLSDANLKGANLNNTNLMGANLKNVSWNKKTTGKMVKSLKEALNVPEELKKQLNQE